MRLLTCLALKSTSVVCSWRTIGVFMSVVDVTAAAAKGKHGDAAVVVVVRRASILVTECIVGF